MVVVNTRMDGWMEGSRTKAEMVMLYRGGLCGRKAGTLG